MYYMVHVHEVHIHVTCMHSTKCTNKIKIKNYYIFLFFEGTRCTIISYSSIATVHDHMSCTY